MEHPPLACRPTALTLQSASVSPCWDMAPGTFGRAYADFMGARGFHADDRSPVRFIDDEELAYVVTRAREVSGGYWVVGEP